MVIVNPYAKKHRQGIACSSSAGFKARNASKAGVVSKASMRKPLSSPPATATATTSSISRSHPPSVTPPHTIASTSTSTNTFTQEKTASSTNNSSLSAKASSKANTKTSSNQPSARKRLMMVEQARRSSVLANKKGSQTKVSLKRSLKQQIAELKRQQQMKKLEKERQKQQLMQRKAQQKVAQEQLKQRQLVEQKRQLELQQARMQHERDQLEKRKLHEQRKQQKENERIEKDRQRLAKLQQKERQQRLSQPSSHSQQPSQSQARHGQAVQLAKADISCIQLNEANPTALRHAASINGAAMQTQLLQPQHQAQTAPTTATTATTTTTRVDSAGIQINQSSAHPSTAPRSPAEVSTNDGTSFHLVQALSPMQSQSPMSLSPLPSSVSPITKSIFDEVKHQGYANNNNNNNNNCALLPNTSENALIPIAGSGNQHAIDATTSAATYQQQHHQQQQHGQQQHGQQQMNAHPTTLAARISNFSFMQLNQHSQNQYNQPWSNIQPFHNPIGQSFNPQATGMIHPTNQPLYSYQHSRQPAYDCTDHAPIQQAQFASHLGQNPSAGAVHQEATAPPHPIVQAGTMNFQHQQNPMLQPFIPHINHHKVAPLEHTQLQHVPVSNNANHVHVPIMPHASPLPIAAQIPTQRKPKPRPSISASDKFRSVLCTNPHLPPSPFATMHQLLPFTIKIVKPASGNEGFGVNIKHEQQSALVDPSWLDEQVGMNVQSSTLVTAPAVAPTSVSAATPKRNIRRRRVFFGVMMVVHTGTQNTRHPATVHKDALLQPNDIILSVDGQNVAGRRFADAIGLFKHCKAAEGSQVIEATLTIARQVRPRPVTTARSTPKPTAASLSSSTPSSNLAPAKTVPSVPQATQQTTLIPSALQPVAAIKAPTKVYQTGDFSALERALVATCMMQALSDSSRLLGHVVDDESLNTIVSRCGMLNRHPTSVKETWSKWATAIISQSANRVAAFSEARRHELRNKPQPSKGCRCGRLDHSYVHDERCMLYDNLKKRISKEELMDIFNIPHAASKSKLTKAEVKSLGAVGTAYKERFDRLMRTKALQEQEVRFVARMEEIQVKECRMAVFAPTLSSMLLSAMLDLQREFPVDEDDLKTMPQGPAGEVDGLNDGIGDGAGQAGVRGDEREKIVDNGENTNESNEGIDDDEDDDDEVEEEEEDVPLLALGKRKLAGDHTNNDRNNIDNTNNNSCVGKDNPTKKQKVENPQQQQQKRRPRISLKYMIHLITYISKRWGHVYREPSFDDIAWRWELFHAEASASSADATRRTPLLRQPQRSLPFEDLQFHAFDGTAVPKLDELKDKLESLSLSANGATATALAMVDKTAITASNTSASSTIMPMQTQAHATTVQHATTVNATDTPPSISEKEAQDMISMAALLRSTQQLHDELMALVMTQVVQVTRTGIPVLTDDWYTKMDVLTLEDYHVNWSADADRDGKFGVVEEFRDALEEHWIRHDYGWALAEDAKDVIHDVEELSEWRRSYEGRRTSKAEREEGIGRFGV